jgi:hypothetical protein
MVDAVRYIAVVSPEVKAMVWVDGLNCELKLSLTAASPILLSHNLNERILNEPGKLLVDPNLAISKLPDE